MIPGEYWVRTAAGSIVALWWDELYEDLIIWLSGRPPEERAEALERLQSKRAEGPPEVSDEQS